MNPNKKQLKKRVKQTFSIHHWTGLVVGIFLLIASITGSILVFHQEIDHLQFADMATLEKPATEMIIDNSFEQVNRLYPAHDIRVTEFSEDPGQALKYEVRKGNTRKWIFTHPETGEILATIDRADQRLVHFLLNIHYNLLSGTTGTVIVMLCGIGLIILSITGFVLYRVSIMKVLTFRQKISVKSRRSFFSSLHRITGVWSLFFNLLISISGTWIAYTIVENAFVPAGVPNDAPPPVTTSVDAPLREIRKNYPEFEINYLRFANGRLIVLGNLLSDPAVYGRTSSKVEVDLSTGQIDKVSFLQNAPISHIATSMVLPLHFGDYLGLGVKILYSFFGILPGVLAVSGFFIWRNRRSKRPIPSRSVSKPLAQKITV